MAFPTFVADLWILSALMIVAATLHVDVPIYVFAPTYVAAPTYMADQIERSILHLVVLLTSFQYS